MLSLCLDDWRLWQVQSEVEPFCYLARVVVVVSLTDFAILFFCWTVFSVQGADTTSGLRGGATGTQTEEVEPRSLTDERNLQFESLRTPTVRNAFDTDPGVFC